MIKRFLAVTGLVLTFFFALACGSAASPVSSNETAENTAVEDEENLPASPSAAESGKETAPINPLIGISVPTAPTGWVAAVQWSAETNAERLGLDYRLLSSDSEASQAEDIDELIQMGCGIIILFPHNDTLSDSAQKIMDAGITLINFDRTLGSVVPDYYVAGDNRQMGVVGAEFIADILGGEGKVAVANVPSYGEIFNSRVSGFKDTVAEKYPNIEIINEYNAEFGSRESGAALLSDILAGSPDGLDAVYSTDDELSAGIVQALMENGNPAGIKAITGGGGAQSYFKLMEEYPEIAISSQTYDPYMMGACVEIAAGLLKGEAFPQTTIISAKNLTKDNYQQWLDENGITEEAPY